MRNRMRTTCCALALALSVLASPVCTADTTVTIVGNVAHAEISLDDGNGGSYDADVTIEFDTPLGLTAESLNLSAEIVDPDNAALNARLPAGSSVDPAFPVLITVEPLDRGALFGNGFGEDEIGVEDLSFENSYSFEIHTHELTYVAGSPYRLAKAPLTGNFSDVTEDVQPGSVRVRGRGGEFSQFIAVDDSRAPLLVALGKLTALTTRTLIANIGGILQTNLLQLLTDVSTALLFLNIPGAIDALDDYILSVEGNAGGAIDNVWRARRDLVNDAGEMLSLARTLRFSLVGAQNRRVNE